MLALRGRVESSKETVLQLHIYAGLLLLPALLFFVGSHLRSHLRLPNPKARAFGFAVALLAVGGCLMGISLWMAPVDRDSGWLVGAHILAFALACALYLLHRLSAKGRRVLGLEKIILPLATAASFGLWLQPSAPASPTTSEETKAPPRGRFDPGLSSAQSADGHTMSLEQLHDPLYCAACHPAIHERWSESAHRFSSLTDPYYRATLGLLQAERPPRDATFCGGCHDPALLLSGAMREHIKEGQPGSDFGVGCLSCHAVTSLPGATGNASYTLGPGTHRRDYAVQDSQAREASARAIRSAPEGHRVALSKPFLRSSEFCRACHKASLTPELTGNHWLRGQNEYDPWEESGAGGSSARTFYEPGPPRRCQDCHMPQIEADDPAARQGRVSDHAFPGSNTALPAHLQKSAWLERSREFMRAIVSLDLAAFERTRDSTTQRVLAPTSELNLRAGDEVLLEFVLRNDGVGHFFPGGIRDLRELWLEVEVLDAAGQPLLASGYVDAADTVDPGAVRWGSVLLDADGRPIRRHEVHETFAVLYGRQIQMGASDLIRVSLPAPARRPALARATARPKILCGIPTLCPRCIGPTAAHYLARLLRGPVRGRSSLRLARSGGRPSPSQAGHRALAFRRHGPEPRGRAVSRRAHASGPRPAPRPRAGRPA